MTATIHELSGSAEFWRCRYNEQLAYIAMYRVSSHTRPDHESVLASANFILEKCTANMAHALEGHLPKVAG
jgi:hypothetical protein